MKETLLPEASPTQRFMDLVAQLKKSMATKMVSYIDSEANELALLLEEHPELSSSKEELEMRLEILDALVAQAWESPGWEALVNRLGASRII